MQRRLVPVWFLLATACGDDTTSSDSSTSGGAGCAPGASCPQVVSECVALADNSAKDKFVLRMSQLTIARPAVFKDPTLAKILSQGVTINLASCLTESGHAPLKGLGTFSWLFEFDQSAGTLRTGGATPEADPSQGYCFVNETIQNSPIAPFSVPAVIREGTFASTTGIDVTVPIYPENYSGNNMGVILLPLRNLLILNGKLSTDQNCIGSFNAMGLSPGNLCLPEDGKPRYLDGAELDGYVTLEDGDKVEVEAIKQSVCVVLSGNTAMFGDGAGKCKRDAANQIVFKGDWCSTTNAPADAGCADAVKLGATFSASAALLKSSCQ